MLKSIQFQNFKILRDCEVPLSPCTLLVGPNASGKSTVLQGLECMNPETAWGRSIRTAGVERGPIAVAVEWADGHRVKLTRREVVPDMKGELKHLTVDGMEMPDGFDRTLEAGTALRQSQVFFFQAERIAEKCKLRPECRIGRAGQNLTIALDRLRDEHPERFEAINEELGRWLPEFDRILFDTPSEGMRALKLRTRRGGHAIPATDISQGTLLALAILTLAYLPEPPSIVGLEEPDRGIHPRLLRDVRDAMYRLAYPESVGESRPPVQVIATTHSPYMLDLFRDHPEEIVIAEKLPEENNVRFTRLSDLPNLDEILADSHLGDVWYSGILGGVPAER